MTIALMRSRMATLVYTSHPSTELKEVLGISLEFKKDILLFCEMSQAIYKKFPDRRQEIWKLIYECMQGIRLVLQMIKSATDDRYKRSLTEWVTITKYAMETSPEAASKRFYGITPDGKRIHLSPKHIKDKIEEVNNFMDKFLEFITKVPFNIRILSNIVRNDPELMQSIKNYPSNTMLRINKKY